MEVRSPMSDEIARCGHCGQETHFERFNARFGNQGFMYCDSDPTVVTWNSYDPEYSELSGDSHPWMLEAAVKARIEAAVIACPNGGHFRFTALPRCPKCHLELPDLSSDASYFVVIADRLDGERSSIWRAPPE
jgi:hypothetical protein